MANKTAGDTPTTKRSLSVLLVSDGWKGPISLRWSMRTVRVALWCCGFFILLVGVGSVSYWQMSQQLSDYELLKSRSDRVERERRALVGVAEKYEQLVQQNLRIRRIFGQTLDLQGGETDENGDQVTESDDMPETPATMNTFPLDMQGRKGGTGEGGVYDHIPGILPVDGFISRGFDAATESPPHLGIDIVADEGSSIRAVASGVVVFSNWTPDHGYTLIVEHGNGFLSYYKHNQANLVSEQDQVTRGAVIGLLGNTGTVSTGPHLHFELWKDGRAVNPTEYLLNL
jgi:murein DD-endopeptidase MepM/ murein hydrolase activator NlpD